MASRVTLMVLTAFWIVMNVLLWRAEFGPQKTPGAAVPVATVWHKILTAPDTSTLNISYHGRKIGFCHWITTIGERWANAGDDSGSPEWARKISSYRIDCDGTVTIADHAPRVRFNASLQLTTNSVWREIRARADFHPPVVEVTSLAGQQSVRIRVDDGGSGFDQTFTFAALRDPQTLLRNLGADSGMAGMLASTALANVSMATNASAPLLVWDARSDTLKAGAAPMSVYRLHTRLLNRYDIVILVSKAGEILRAELPDDVLLVNEQLTGS